MMPLARHDDLVTQELNDELLVYDSTNCLTHCLDRATASIWRHCDGQKDVSELASILTDTTGTDADESVVGAILEELDKVSLLEGKSDRPIDSSQFSRRKVMKYLAVAGSAGFVATIVAPTPAQARTGVVR